MIYYVKQRPTLAMHFLLEIHQLKDFDETYTHSLIHSYEKETRTH